MGHQEHALVFGASGILGWAVVNEILDNYPAKGTYSKVTALTNRPLSKEDSLWPDNDGKRPELSIVTGIDLTKGSLEDVKTTLQQRVPDIDSVTHVYYFGTSSIRESCHVRLLIVIVIKCSIFVSSRLPYRV